MLKILFTTAVGLIKATHATLGTISNRTHTLKQKRFENIMGINKIKVIGLRNRLQVRIKDFSHVCKNQGIKAATLKSLFFIYKKFLKINNANINNNLRKVVIFATQAEQLIKQINIESQSSNRQYLNEIRTFVIINPKEVERNKSYIIFCASNEYIHEAFYIRSQSWKNKLITTNEALKGTSETDHFLYVDHIIDRSHMKNGFIGNINENFHKYYEFYTSLWSDANKKFGLLNLQDEPEKTIDKVRSQKKKYSIHVQYNIENLEISSCQTFNQIIEKSNIKISKVSEDVFWQFNNFTQSDLGNCKDFLKEALAKGVFVSEELT